MSDDNTPQKKSKPVNQNVQQKPRRADTQVFEAEQQDSPQIEQEIEQQKSSDDELTYYEDDEIEQQFQEFLKNQEENLDQTKKNRLNFQKPPLSGTQVGMMLSEKEKDQTYPRDSIEMRSSLIKKQRQKKRVIQGNVEDTNATIQQTHYDTMGFKHKRNYKVIYEAEDLYGREKRQSSILPELNETPVMLRKQPLYQDFDDRFNKFVDFGQVLQDDKDVQYDSAYTGRRQEVQPLVSNKLKTNPSCKLQPLIGIKMNSQSQKVDGVMNKNQDHKLHQNDDKVEGSSIELNKDKTKVFGGEDADRARRLRKGQCKNVDVSSLGKAQVPDSDADNTFEEEKKECSQEEESGDEIEINANVERCKQFIASVRVIDEIWKSLENLNIDKMKQPQEKLLFLAFQELLGRIISDVFNGSFCELTGKELAIFKDPIAYSKKDGAPDEEKLYQIESGVTDGIDLMNDIRKKYIGINHYLSFSDIDKLTSYQRLQLINILVRSVFQQFEKELMTTIGFTTNVSLICKKLEDGCSISRKDFKPKVNLIILID
eukprot:403350616